MTTEGRVFEKRMEGELSFAYGLPTYKGGRVYERMRRLEQYCKWNRR